MIDAIFTLFIFSPFSSPLRHFIFRCFFAIFAFRHAMPLLRCRFQRHFRDTPDACCRRHAARYFAIPSMFFAALMAATFRRRFR